MSLIEAIEAHGCPGTVRAAAFCPGVPNTLLRAAFQGALSVKSLNLGWNMCFVQFLGMLLGVAAVLVGRGRPSPSLTPKFALPQFRICCALAAVAPWLPAGGGGRVLGGETSGWRHEE